MKPETADRMREIISLYGKNPNRTEQEYLLENAISAMMDALAEEMT